MLAVEDRQRLLKRVRDLGHNDEPWLDDAEQEIKVAIRRKGRTLDGRESPDDDDEAFDEDDDVHGLERTSIDSKVIASQIATLARKQARAAGRLSRRMVRITPVLRRRLTLRR